MQMAEDAEYLQDVWRAMQGAVISKDGVKSLCGRLLAGQGSGCERRVWEHPERSSWLPS